MWCAARDVPQHRRRRDLHDRQNRDLPPRQKSHDDRPHQIKLLFDRQRPRHTQRPRRIGRKRQQEILQEKRIRPPGRRLRKNRNALRSAHVWQHHKHERQQAVIQRPNTQNAPRIKILEVVGRFFRVQQDAADQKSRQHKKQIDAHPPAVKQRMQIRRRAVVQRSVVRDDQQNRDPAQRIKLRNLLSHCSWQKRHHIRRDSGFLPLRLADDTPQPLLQIGAWFQSPD